MTRRNAICLMIGLALGGAVAAIAQPADELSPFLHAIAHVESNHNDDAVGDGGKSIGRYQIGHAYWMDSRVPGSWAQVKEKDYAERVMVAYWRRYCPDALKARDFEVLARVHNGGPKGATKAATKGYWAKVKGAMP